MMPKKSLYVVVCLFIFGVVYMAVLNTAHRTSYETLLKNCSNTDQQSYIDCVFDKITKIQIQHPEKTGELLDYTYHNLRKFQPIDERLFSDNAHFVGMELAYKKYDLAEGLKICGKSFKSACMHGFVMERVDNIDVNSKNLATLLAYCKLLKLSPERALYLNCMHGIGHEIRAKSQTSLFETLMICDALKESDTWDACVSGVLMEYSKGGDATGKHSHHLTGSTELPCNELGEKYQAICYSASGSYRQYVPGHESAQESYLYCSKTPFAMLCMSAVSERLLMAVAGDKNLATKNCVGLPAYMQKDCRASLLVR
jgi:hypothetical protein